MNVPVILGLYASSADRTHALTAIVAGIVSLLAAHFTTDGKGYFGLTPPLIGLITSALAALIALALRPAASPRKLTT